MARRSKRTNWICLAVKVILTAMLMKYGVNQVELTAQISINDPFWIYCAMSAIFWLN